MSTAPLEASSQMSLNSASLNEAYNSTSPSTSEPTDLTPSLAFGVIETTIIFDEKGKMVGSVPAGQTPEWQCVACLKGFSTKQSLSRHKTRHPLCREWEHKGLETKHVFGESVYVWATRTVDQALASQEDGIRCKFCMTQFATIGNLHKHFTTAVACNRMGYLAVTDAFDKFEINEV
jgi:hypothetical protein